MKEIARLEAADSISLVGPEGIARRLRAIVEGRDH